MINLYHGTSAKQEILNSGFNTALVFLTSRIDVAESYADEVVIVSVDADDLLIDLDQQGAIGLTVSQANLMTDNYFSCAEQYLDAGYSVCVKAENVKLVK